MKKGRLRTEDGFTLIEMLLVLFVVIILTGIVMKISLKASEKREIDQFFLQFQQDILFIQAQNMNEIEKVLIKVDAINDQYVLKTPENKILYIRPFPKNVKFLLSRSTISRIEYNSNGNIRNPGTLRFQTPDHVKELVITFGVGRVIVRP